MGGGGKEGGMGGRRLGRLEEFSSWGGRLGELVEFSVMGCGF